MGGGSLLWGRGVSLTKVTPCAVSRQWLSTWGPDPGLFLQLWDPLQWRLWFSDFPAVWLKLSWNRWSWRLLHPLLLSRLSHQHPSLQGPDLLLPPRPQCPLVTPTRLISSRPQLLERTGPTEPVRRKYEYLKSVSWQEHKNDHHRWLETSDPYRFPSWLKAACMFHLVVKLTP